MVALGQENDRGLNLSPTQEENNIHNSAKDRGSQLLGTKSGLLLQQPLVPNVIRSKIPKRELLILRS